MRIFAVSSIPRCAGLCALLACAASIAFAQSKPIPQLTKSGDKFTFMVDGKPFIMLGGQVGNFSAFPDLMERAWPALKAMNLNTVEYPVYWNVVEPEEPSARVMIAELGPDEFLVMGFESSVEWRPVQGSDFTAAQFISVEEGVFEGGVWKRTLLGRTAQGDYAGPTVSLSAQGALMRVKLMRY